MREKPR